MGTLLDETATQLGQADIRKLALDDKTNAVRDLLAERAGEESPLLVMDNFETAAEPEQKRIVEFLASAPAAALITSRQIVPRVRNIEIDAMGDAEAREFVRRSIEQSPRRAALAGLDPARIIQTADANPLVMEWVIAQIAEEAHEPRRVFDELAHGKGDAAQRVFDRSFNLLNDDARAALAAVTELNADVCDTTITRLVSLRLVETTTLNARVGVAGLTRELARARFKADERRFEWTNRFVNHFVEYAKEHRFVSPKDLDALEEERDNLLSAMDIAYTRRNWYGVGYIAKVINGSIQVLGTQGAWADAIEHAKQMTTAARRELNEPIYELRIFFSRSNDYDEDARRMREIFSLLSSTEGHDLFTFFVPNPQGVVQLDFPNHRINYTRVKNSLHELMNEWGTLEVDVLL